VNQGETTMTEAQARQLEQKMTDARMARMSAHHLASSSPADLRAEQDHDPQFLTDCLAGLTSALKAHREATAIMEEAVNRLEAAKGVEA
jgi:hypothetical protein